MQALDTKDLRRAFGAFATGVTVVMTGGVTLLVRLGSPVGVITLAIFVRLPEAGAVTVTVTLLI